MVTQMHIKVEYSSAACFGSTDPVEEGIDEAASLKQFGESLVNYLYDAYPDAEIEVKQSINDRVTVNGMRDYPEAGRVDQIVEKVWNGDDWLVYL